jgi:hypothetical protein
MIDRLLKENVIFPERVVGVDQNGLAWHAKSWCVIFIRGKSGAAVPLR